MRRILREHPVESTSGTRSTYVGVGLTRLARLCAIDDAHRELSTRIPIHPRSHPYVGRVSILLTVFVVSRTCFSLFLSCFSCGLQCAGTTLREVFTGWAAREGGSGSVVFECNSPQPKKVRDDGGGEATTAVVAVYFLFFIPSRCFGRADESCIMHWVLCW